MQESRVIAALSGLDETRLEICEKLEAKPEGQIGLVAGPVQIYLPLTEFVDPAEEHARLTKDLSEAQTHITRLEKLLSSDFANKAPAAVVQKEREKLAAYIQTARKIQAQLG